MFSLISGIAWMSIVAWLLFRAIRQFQKYQVVEPAPAATLHQAQNVTVVIPARNEAANIGRCLSGLLAQDYPAEKLTVRVVDDNSTDQTSEIVRRIAETDPRVQLIQSAPLPSGWAGKPHACWQGAAAAGESIWLCFVDADTVAQPALISSAVRTAAEKSIDMLSLEPFQQLISFWERLIIPAGFFLLAFTQDIGKVNDPSAKEAVANGQFILIRRKVYEAIDGHAGVRDAICEDTALARAVKGNGYRLAVMGAEKLIQTRMYTGFWSLWEGVSKNATEMVGGALPAIVFAFMGILLGAAAVLVPLWTATSMHTTAGVIGASLAALASIALFSTYIGAACHFRIPWWYGLLFPIGSFIGAAVLFNSVNVRLRKRVRWKDREYLNASPADHNEAKPPRQPETSRLGV